MPTSTSDDAGIEVRPATEGDSEAVWHLWIALQTLHTEADPTNYRPPTDQAGFRDHFNNALSSKNSEPLVAERGGEVVGYMVLWDVRPESNFVRPARHWLDIEVISVAEGARRSGVAKTLLGYAKRAARRRGVNRIEVGVRAFNVPAVAAYERLGFRHDFHKMTLALDHEGEN
jgi:ribosomal protein S18 acetylase RimI-like enzyme